MIANLITGSRIVFSLVLLIFPVFSPPFYILYSTAGISDIADGIVARRTNTVSEFGAKLDTAADFSMVAVCLFKYVPVLHIEIWIYIWVAIIFVIKSMNGMYSIALYKKLPAVHSVMNKITGVLLFVLPLTLKWIDLRYSAVVICTLATLSAVQEGYFIKIGRKF